MVHNLILQLEKHTHQFLIFPSSCLDMLFTIKSRQFDYVVKHGESSEKDVTSKIQMNALNLF